MKNTVTLFSNGIGHFKRHYAVTGKNPLKISIPCSTKDISDILESITVFGEGVKLDSPPTFTPSNNDLTSLDFTETESYSTLLNNLSGAEISINGNINGTLLGVESNFQSINGQQVLISEELVYEKDGKVYKKSLSAITSVDFVQDVVKSEIKKALKNKFSKIKPNSTMIELSISSDKNTDAYVYYKLPVASWKMRYSLRQEKGNAFLEGSAIIDNNTEEDWSDFLVSVVTGNPISFATDLGQVVVPTRDFIKLVDDHNPVNTAMYASAAAAPMGGRARAMSPDYKSKAMLCSASNTRGYSNTNTGLEACGFEPASEVATFDSVGGMAEMSSMEAKDVGDFCVFTGTTPVSITSKQSAIVPMFLHPLKNTANVLLFRNKNTITTRPFRAFKFKNETELTLSKGKVVVYQDGLFSGESLMEMSKPGEVKTLAYCIENGVKVTKKVHDVETTSTGFSLKGRMCVSSFSDVLGTTYTVKNLKKEEFKFVIEHTCDLANAEVHCANKSVRKEKASENTWRLTFTLAEDKEFSFRIDEQSIRNSSFGINDNWVVTNSDKLIKSSAMKDCVEICKKIANVETTLNEHNSNLSSLQSDVSRIRENLKAVGTMPEIASSMANELVETESQIKALNKSAIPSVQKELRTLRETLNKKLDSVSFDWTNNDKPQQIVSDKM